MFLEEAALHFEKVACEAQASLEFCVAEDGPELLILLRSPPKCLY